MSDEFFTNVWRLRDQVAESLDAEHEPPEALVAQIKENAAAWQAELVALAEREYLTRRDLLRIRSARNSLAWLFSVSGLGFDIKNYHRVEAAIRKLRDGRANRRLPFNHPKKGASLLKPQDVIDYLNHAIRSWSKVAKHQGCTLAEFLRHSPNASLVFTIQAEPELTGNTGVRSFLSEPASFHHELLRLYELTEQCASDKRAKQVEDYLRAFGTNYAYALLAS